MRNGFRDILKEIWIRPVIMRGFTDIESKSRLDPLSDHPTIWSNTLKQFVGKLPTNCLGVFDHFVGLPLLKRLTFFLIVFASNTHFSIFFLPTFLNLVFTHIEFYQLICIAS